MKPTDHSDSGVVLLFGSFVGLQLYKKNTIVNVVKIKSRFLQEVLGALFLMILGKN